MRRLFLLDKKNLRTPLCLLLLTAAFSANPEQTRLPEDTAEQILLQALSAIDQQNWETAATHSETLRELFPNFRLGNIIAEAATSQTAPATAGPTPIAPEEDEFMPEALLAELQLRRQYQAPAEQQVPANILKLADNIKHALLVDMTSARFYLLEHKNNQLIRLADYYAGIGKQGTGKQLRGDHRTPIGIYQITGYLPDKKLAELYGIGALTLSYPNNWDRLLKRTGDGIWLHGVPRDTYSRTPRSSRGCVTLSNTLFDAIRHYAKTGKSPVILADNVEWLEPIEQQQLAGELLNALNNWQTDWESLNFENYIKHYATEFKTEKLNYQGWKNKKRHINQNKTSIEVELSDISIYRYPGENNLVQIDYRQSYRSNNFNARANKTQYWRKSAENQWQIVYEGLRRH